MATESSSPEAAKKERTVMRTLFTKNANQLETMMDTSTDELTITTQYLRLQAIHRELAELDRGLRKYMCDGDESDLEKEVEGALAYTTRWVFLDCRYKNRTESKAPLTTETRKFKLPPLQFITYDGDLKGWLPFWGQFQKIDDDTSIDHHDKYQYLLQAMKQGSEPRRLVESFTPAAYYDCIIQLKNRYAREDLLIQVYVRELLGMVNKSEENSSIITLFDKLSAQLRALESLGVTKDKFAAFLLPMVESALPQEILQIWERTKAENKNVTGELSDLLTFLRKEVESEQRIRLAKITFTEKDTIECPKQPTAGCLLTNVKPKQQLCVWCDKNSHNSLECYKLQKMSIDERRAVLKKKKACAICLKRGHHPKNCRAYIKCVICGLRHAVVLCTGQKQEANVPGTTNNKNNCASQENTNTTANYSSTKQTMGTTLLQTVLVIIRNGQKQVTVRAMFDNGAQRSYIREDIARKLSITPVSKENLSHTLFGGVETTSRDYNVYDINVSSLDKSFTFSLTALGQKCICNNIPVYTNTHNLSQILTKHNIALSDNSHTSNDIGLLIGADFSGLVITGGVIKLHDSLIAINTKLGWTLQGKIMSTPSSHIQSAHVAMFCSPTNVSNFWSLETLGIRDPIDKKTKEQNEEEVLMTFEENVKVNEEGRYEVLLPWKVGHDELFNNYNLSLRRLESVTKRLKIDNLFEDYDKVIDEWRDLNIIEIVPDPHIDLDSSHYLPHRPVIKEKSLTTRIRPVFDASAKDHKGRSLNLCLDKGVNMIDRIPKLINGFRKGAIGITADIAKAFLQVSVSPKDRNMLRFLWWDKNNNEMITYRHCRVVFGLTSSPFLLSATIQHHLNQVTGTLHKSAEILANSFYVDNCLTSLDTPEDVIKFESEAKIIMSQAKFDLTQWTIAPIVGQNYDKVVSVLGLEWHTAEDELSCNMTDLPQAANICKITKRHLLSLAQRIYDPIGFTAPVILVPRLILQETWQRKLGWDDELPVDLKKKFLSWYETLHFLNNCRIPRRLTLTPFNKSILQLHMFCDASQQGYAACVYLRAENKGNISVRLILAKSRVSPPGKITIPRLELLAALIGSRLLTEARKDLKLNGQEYCWTDSVVALCWIKKELPWNTYIGNRVKEIRQSTNVDNWFHISGISNWADLASRGCDAAHLLSSRWLEGPAWLYSTPQDWPKPAAVVMDEAEARRELKKLAVCNTNLCLGGGMSERLSYFSKYTKIVRTLAWMLRFAYNTRNNAKLKGDISYEEYEKSEQILIRLIQAENREYIENKLQGLTYFYDIKDSLIKIKTKLVLTDDIPESTKFPVVIPAHSSVARSLARQRHEQMQHAGLAIVMADLRTRYWLIGARNMIKSVITNCSVCRRHRAKPLQAPAAPLPPERTQSSAPFETTGVDLAGPLYLRGGEKCWVVLYTCAVYRAVHLEVTKSLSTESFLMTLRRFIARRGRVSVIMSDNGTNFVGTKNLLSQLDWDEIQRQSTIRHIKWKLNAPTAAWWGGFWERLIKILKDLLKRVLGQSSVTYIELETILCDCEATMNGRPLTYVEDDKTHSLEPLKPSHFLQPLPQADEVADIDLIDTKSLNKRLRYIQKLRDDFRKRFRTEYLTTLVQKGKEKKDNLNIGDIVLVETEEKRVKWPIGRIEEIFIVRDGTERSAKVKTSTGFKVRPYQRLYKLEVSDPKGELPNVKPVKEVMPAVPANTHKASVTSFVPGAPAPTTVTEQNQTKVKTTKSGRISRLPSKYLI